MTGWPDTALRGPSQAPDDLWPSIPSIVFHR